MAETDEPPAFTIEERLAALEFLVVEQARAIDILVGRDRKRGNWREMIVDLLNTNFERVEDDERRGRQAVWTLLARAEPPTKVTR